MSADQGAELVALDEWAFPHDPTGIDPAPALAELEWERTFGARLTDPDRLSGVYTAYSVSCPVPGAEVPAAGLSWVGVHPRDRRRGVRTAMIGHHLADVAAHGEPFSLLYAAEPAIYGRFGYGLASQTLTFGL